MTHIKIFIILLRMQRHVSRQHAKARIRMCDCTMVGKYCSLIICMCYQIETASGWQCQPVEVSTAKPKKKDKKSVASAKQLEIANRFPQSFFEGAYRKPAFKIIHKTNPGPFRAKQKKAGTTKRASVWSRLGPQMKRSI